MTFAAILAGVFVLATAFLTALIKVGKIWDIPTKDPVEPPKQPPKPSLPPNKPDMPKKVYEAAKASLGKHLTLDNSIDPEEGCAQALSVILLKAGYPMPKQGISSVLGMIAWMKAAGFTELSTPQVGCIITAHNASPSITSEAHIGVYMKNGICSNTSANGLWEENYRSLKNWNKGFPHSQTRFFLPV